MSFMLSLRLMGTLSPLTLLVTVLGALTLLADTTLRMLRRLSHYTSLLASETLRDAPLHLRALCSG